MENASKALIMAGSVLIALVVISVVVFFFNNIRDLQKTNMTSDEVQQVTEFNKQFDVYTRNVYGSELLSIANKIVDYNKRESDSKGYIKIVLEVKISDDSNPNTEIFNKGKDATYDENDFNTIKEKIDKELAKFSDRKKNEYTYTNGKYSRTIAQLASMRTNEIADLLGIEENGQKMSEINVKIAEYYSYKNLLSEIKQKVFKYKNFDYDKITGRIIKMSYEI